MVKALVFYKDWSRTLPLISSHVEAEKPEDYLHVATYADVPDREEILGTIFTDLNREGQRKFSFLPRSMSVGDVVVFEDLDVRICAPSGWEQRDDLKEWIRRLIMLRGKVGCDICYEVGRPMSDQEGICGHCMDWIHKQCEAPIFEPECRNCGGASSHCCNNPDYSP